MRGRRLFLIACLIAGAAYGFGARTFRSDADVMSSMGKSMETLGVYLVLTFFAAQFVAFFNWTQLGLVFAVNGATALKALGLPAVPLFVSFILLTAAVNRFMGSASAKWALMAPVFVPMFMLLGFTPELVQGVYRIGNSATNMIRSATRVVSGVQPIGPNKASRSTRSV